MSLYRITTDKLELIERTTFAAASVFERKDLQRLLRRDINVIAEDLMVIAEEYGEWEDSNRRIDLLCLGKDASLVVVEIKRTEDGGHMELQAIRYAAMVSSMTLEQVVQAYARSNGSDIDAARSEILEFLQWEGEEPAELTGEVRIILASADFSTELTTAVLWLNRHDLNITCIRLRPYKMDNQILIESTQLIPLPESADYEVKIREQEREKKKVLGRQQEDLSKFWSQTLERCKNKTSRFASRKATVANWINLGIGRSGFMLNMVLRQEFSIVECYIRIDSDGDKSSAAFQALYAQKDAIEAKFGSALDWQKLPNRIGCRICKEMSGGWKSPESEWPEIQDRMIDALIRLDDALRQPIQELKI
jgi:hypothetical protein